MSQVDEIKSRLDIIDVISEYIQLKPAGANWKARCPFHSDNSPSFMVSRDKQIYHCFGCGAGGDIISFVQEYEGMDFPEALQLLADKAGVPLQKFDKGKTSQKQILFDINRFAAEVFHKVLNDTKGAQEARAYLVNRGIRDATMKDFKLGYAPDSWDFLLKLLKQKGFKEHDILASGLEVKNNRGGMYDRFRGRVMFPVANAQGNIVGFTARLLKDDGTQGGKYINTPQTPIYNKSAILFGLDKAKRAIKEEDAVVVVEGNMDVIASHQAGVQNVVASSGTALTLDQLSIIKRYTHNVILSFDMDAAGQMAAEKGIELALQTGLNIKVIQLPPTINGTEIKDPDDCIKADIKEWKHSIVEAIPVMEYFFNRYFSLYDHSTPSGKQQIATALLQKIMQMQNEVERDAWITTLSQHLGTSEGLLREITERYNSKSQNPIETPQAKTHRKEEHLPRAVRLAQELLALITLKTEFFPTVIEAIDSEMIIDDELKTLYNELVSSYNSTTHFDTVSFETSLEENKKSNILETFQTISLLADKDFSQFTGPELEKELHTVIKELQVGFINQKIISIQKRIQVAEKEQNNALIEELSQQFTHFIEKLNKLKSL